MERTSVKRNYVFLAIMLGAMVAGAAVGWFFPVVKDACIEQSLYGHQGVA